MKSYFGLNENAYVLEEMLKDSLNIEVRHRNIKLRYSKCV